MAILMVVSNPKNWPLSIPGVEVVSSRSYLTEAKYAEMKNAKIFNLCRSYRYQSSGYYVSLLASARGHKPIPNIVTLRDMRSPAITRIITEDLDENIQKSLKNIQSDTFILSIYFGQNPVEKYSSLSMQIHQLFQAPLIRVHFIREKDWQVKHIELVPTSEIPESHRDFVVQRAIDYFNHKGSPRKRKDHYRYDLAILHDPNEQLPPSNERALKLFAQAAESLHLHTEFITKDDIGSIAEFDGLFIRVTTKVNHYSYHFARRAQTEGLVVIDDPESIIRCSNKVYLQEVLKRYRLRIPKTWVIHRDNLDDIQKEIFFPCILKLPDSSFSRGVLKVENTQDLLNKTAEFFKQSDLVIVQEYIPTPFDWRIGIINNTPLFACKYYMARHHWQIIKKSSDGKELGGRVETFAIENTPKRVVNLALQAAHLIGDGFYGVDIKYYQGKSYVIEINDNPSIESGFEDEILKKELYHKVMKVFFDRINKKKAGL
ncbi:MAG: RimK family protein [Chlamydiota bacterium]|nr:RimK family protein [Chlamydiota bacterium]